MRGLFRATFDHLPNVSTSNLTPLRLPVCSFVSASIYPLSVRLYVRTNTLSGLLSPSRRRRLRKNPIRDLSLSNAVVVFPLPAAPRINSTPGRVLERIFNCSGVGVTLRSARIYLILSGKNRIRPHEGSSVRLQVLL